MYVKIVCRGLMKNFAIATNGIIVSSSWQAVSPIDDTMN